MPDPLDTGALLSRTYALRSGPRVRLRLARRADADGVRALLHQRGIDATDLDVERLVLYDPGERVVICATAPLDGRETVVGVGAIDLADGVEPETIVVDERLTDGLAELLHAALLGRAHTRRVA